MKDTVLTVTVRTLQLFLYKAQRRSGGQNYSSTHSKLWSMVSPIAPPPLTPLYLLYLFKRRLGGCRLLEKEKRTSFSLWESNPGSSSQYVVAISTELPSNRTTRFTVSLTTTSRTWYIHFETVHWKESKMAFNSGRGATSAWRTVF
jgi:hypothetical protein